MPACGSPVFALYLSLFSVGLSFFACFLNMWNLLRKRSQVNKPEEESQEEDRPWIGEDLLEEPSEPLPDWLEEAQLHLGDSGERLVL
jgi:hypothetical protein